MFSYIVVVVTEHFTSMSIEWWTVLLTVGLTALVSYARVSVEPVFPYLETRTYNCVQVQLGVHYPSDCVGGVLMVNFIHE